MIAAEAEHPCCRHCRHRPILHRVPCTYCQVDQHQALDVVEQAMLF